MKITMMPEEEFNQAVWWALREIKMECLATLKDVDIHFGLKDEDKKDIPKTDNQSRALKFLEKQEAIKTVDKKYPVPSQFVSDMTAEMLNMRPLGYILDVLQPKFDEIYEEYRTNNSEQAPATISKKVFPANQKALLSFDAKTGEIILSKKKCSIPLGSNQFQLCKAIFEKPLGEWLKEIDVIESFFRGSEGKRSFYDAIHLINQKMYKNFGIKKMLEYKASSVRVRKYTYE